MEWNKLDVMESVKTYTESVNEQEKLKLSFGDLEIFQRVISEFADGMAEKLNKATDGEIFLRTWIKGLILLSYVRMSSIGKEKWEAAIQDVFRGLECLFPIIDPRCN